MVTESKDSGSTPSPVVRRRATDLQQTRLIVTNKSHISKYNDFSEMAIPVTLAYHLELVTAAHTLYTPYPCYYFYHTQIFFNIMTKFAR